MLDDDFKPDDEREGEPSDLALKEKALFKESAVKPNTIVIPLGKTGHISFNPPNSTSIFAVIALFVLLITTIIISFFGIWFSDVTWADTLMGGLGHAITAVVGAIVGASVASKSGDGDGI